MDPLPTRKRPSRARWLVPLAILFVFVAFAGGLGLLLLGASLAGEKVAGGSVLELRLGGDLHEAPDPLASLFPGLAGPPHLFEIRQALLRAAKDSRIAGVKVDIDAPGLGWAEAEELQEVFADFRAEAVAAERPVGKAKTKGKS